MNTLRHRAEFQKILASYRLSETAKQTLARTKLTLLVGPTSSGRNTIINELVQTGQYHQIVSDTTRQPRENNGLLEENGREYWFRSEDDMLRDLQSGEFLEAAIIHDQQVSGISIRELESAASKQKIAINEVEVVGAEAIHAAKLDACFMFVIPPSFDEWVTRMTARGKLPADEVERRLRSAVQEISTALACDYYWFIVNDTFKHAASYIDNLVKTGAIADKEQSNSRKIAKQLLADTKRHLG